MLRPMRHVRARLTRLGTIVALVAVLSGCGENEPTDEQQIRAALAEFGRATAAHDYQALCDRVLAPKLIETVKQIGLPCEVALEKGFEGVSEPRVSVGAITVKDTTATAEVRSSAAGQEPSEDTVELIKVGEGWRIASLGSAAAP